MFNVFQPNGFSLTDDHLFLLHPDRIPDLTFSRYLTTWKTSTEPHYIYLLRASAVPSGAGAGTSRNVVGNAVPVSSPRPVIRLGDSNDFPKKR